MGDRFEPLVFLADYAGEGLTVNCLCIDSRSMLWVGMSDGVCCFDPQKKTLQWIERGAFVTDILELPQGLAVASTCGSLRATAANCTTFARRTTCRASV